MESTLSAQIIQNSGMTQLFIYTGMVAWGFIALIGIITVGRNAFRGFFPKKIKGIK